MKKLLLSFMAIMGFLSVVGGPIQFVHAQSNEIAPLCQIGPPRFQTSRGTFLYQSSTGPAVHANLQAGVNLQPGAQGVSNGRRHVILNRSGVTVIGWVETRDIFQTTC